MKNFDDIQLLLKTNEYHENLEETLSVFPYPIDEYKIITIIRNPFDMIKSAYFYWRNFPGQNIKINMARTKNINEFAIWFVKNFRNYEDFLSVKKAVPEYLNIFKLEKIKEDVNEFFNVRLKMDIEADIPRLNFSKHESYFFDSKSMELIYERYKWCFDLGFYKK